MQGALLLEYEVAKVIEAVDLGKITPGQIEGAVRLFGSWDFQRNIPVGLKLISDELKTALWNHVRTPKTLTN